VTHGLKGREDRNAYSGNTSCHLHAFIAAMRFVGMCYLVDQGMHSAWAFVGFLQGVVNARRVCTHSHIVVKYARGWISGQKG
jgi:hypothetical protein